MTRLLASALAVLALVAATGSNARTSAGSAGYWIVIGSDRDGTTRPYSMRPDGSRLAPLLAPGQALSAQSVSDDGQTIAYEGDRGLYVSRANGTGLHRVVRQGGGAALSPNGRLLAFRLFGKRDGLAVVGTDGRGLRRLTTGEDDAPSWSPDGKALVFHRYVNSENGDSVIVVRPLRGKTHVLARSQPAQWSPDGRWIAYTSPTGLDATQPDGRGRHHVFRGSVSGFAWSPDGGRLAISSAGQVVVATARGRVVRRMRLREQIIGRVDWSPDGRRIAFESGPYEAPGIAVVSADGRGFRRVVSEGHSGLVGWTRLAPVRPPAPPVPPSERIASTSAVATREPVDGLSADGGRVAFAVGGTTVDCDHVVVWTPSKKTLARFQKRAVCGEGNNAGFVYDVQLAGSRVGWSEIISCGNYCEAGLVTATLTGRSPQPLAYDAASSSDDDPDFHARGAGDLLVYDDGSRLVRIGVGSERCQQTGDYDTRICSTLRRGSHAVAVDSVSGGLIAIREPNAVAVVDAKGTLVRVFPFASGEVTAARLDGGRLFVATGDVLAAYDVSTGAALFERSLPHGFELRDVDGGIAVLQSGSRVTLLRLADRRSFTLTLRGRVLADLAPDGLYYSYGTAGGGGRVVLMPRSEVDRKLGGSARAFAAARSSWIVLGSDRDGQVRPYSVRADGSRLTLLVPPTPASLTPRAVSRNGRVVVYDEAPTGEIYASRGSGAGLRKLRARGLPEALSSDGRRLAYQDDGIWIVGTDGRGRRRLSSSSWEYASGWSPTGDALLVATQARRGERPQKAALWIQPLRGRRRLLARGAGDGAWSPDGRWIAYHLGEDLWAVQSDGRRRHRVARRASEFEWSQEGRRLAFGRGKDIVIVGVDAGRLRTIRARGVLFVVSASWSPDGRRLAFAARVRVIHRRRPSGERRRRRRTRSAPPHQPGGQHTRGLDAARSGGTAGAAAAPERACPRERVGRGPATDFRPVR